MKIFLLATVPTPRRICDRLSSTPSVALQYTQQSIANGLLGIVWLGVSGFLGIQK